VRGDIDGGECGGDSDGVAARFGRARGGGMNGLLVVWWVWACVSWRGEW
jgi:hypothetical protein